MFLRVKQISRIFVVVFLLLLILIVFGTILSEDFIVKKRNEKSYQVQAFCEERGLTPLIGVIW